MVVTSRTRNAVVRKGTWVRIPPSPPCRRKLHIACGDFFTKVTGVLIPLRLLFRKKSRSARLFGCKCPYNGSLSLPTFCESREFNSHLRKAEEIFFMCLSHVVADFISSATAFLYKVIAHPFQMDPLRWASIWFMQQAARSEERRVGKEC